MADYPLDMPVSDSPLMIGRTMTRTVQPKRAQDEAITVSILTDTPKDDAEFLISSGDRPIVQNTKRLVEENKPQDLESMVDESMRRGDSPETAAAMVQDELKKRDWWSKSGDDLYLEYAFALNDPYVNSEAARISVNLQIGQELFEQELESAMEDTGIAGYVTDFIDRYFIRAFPIGGLEQVTNRNERKGRELLAAATTMEPQEFRIFVSDYIEELRGEGVFLKDNVFAIMDGAAEWQNKGYDDMEWFNRSMGVLDLAPALAVVKAGKLVKAGTPLTRIAALKGPEVAAEAGEAAIKTSRTVPDPRLLNDMGAEATSPTKPAPVKVPTNRIVRIAEENKLVQEISRIVNSGSLGRGASTSDVQLAFTSAIDTLRRFANNPIVNVSNPVTADVTGNPLMSVTLGTVKTGAPFKTEGAAQKMAAKVRDEFPTAKVIKVDETDESLGYYVQVDKLLDANKYVDEVGDRPMYDAVRNALAKFMGSKGATEAYNLQNLAVMAEGVSSAIGGNRIARQLVRDIESVGAKSQKIISQILSELRDGKDAFLREFYSEQEFADKVYKIAGRMPTEKEYAAMAAIQTINDASYIMRAHNRLQKYIASDYYAVEMPGVGRVPARRVEGLGRDDVVLDIQSGTLVDPKNVSKAKVWELDREVDGIQYITRPSEVKTLSHDDVLGYNAGGRRIGPEDNYFVTFGDETPRAFMTTTTAKEAETAVEQIGNIRDAIRAAGGLDTVTDVDSINDVIRANNDWNPEIQDLDGLKAFLKDRKLNIADDVNYKIRDGQIRTGEIKDFFSETWDEYVQSSMSRSDDMLMAYGGKEPMQYDPVNAIFQDFTSTTHHFSANVYTNSAINGWLKGARREGSGWHVPPSTGNPRADFMNATMVETKSGAAGELSRQRNIINRRLNIKSEPFRAMENIGASLQEFVFGATKGKVRLPRDPAGGASQFLLNVGFRSAFGFGNVSQFFVQGFHASTVMAISPKYGSRAFLMGLPMQALLHTTDPDALALGVSRMAKHFGMEEKTIREMVEYFHTSGRNIVDGGAIEQGTGAAWGVSGWKGESLLPSALKDAKSGVGKFIRGADRLGLQPFSQGERLARTTGVITALLEHASKNPGKSLLDPAARQMISRREQALTFRMTNANRAFVQEGFGKLPTQWFTYTLRAMESVVVGRDLDKGERFRLAMFLGPMFGLTGLGFGSAADYISEQLGAEEGGQFATFIQRGLLDWAVETTTGAEVALAERLAPITLITDVYRNITEGSALAVALGPSGDITGGIINALAETVGEMYHGHSVSMTEDAIRVARQASGVNNVFTAMGIWHNNMYRSRTGKQLPFELNETDAIMQLFGFSPREVSDWYAATSLEYRHSRDVKDFSTEMKNDYQLAMEIFADDPQRGLQMLSEINTKIALSGFSLSDQITVRRTLQVTTSQQIHDIIMGLHKRGDGYSARSVEEKFDFIGESK